MLLLLSSFTACGTESQSMENESASPAPSTPATMNNSAAESVESIHVEIKDLQSNLNQWHRFSLDVFHNTDKYLTAEICGRVFDAEGDLLGETTVFINNLGSAPSDWVSEPFLAKGSSEYMADYEVISFEFTDGFPATPEITSDNVKNYLRLTTEDLGDVLGDDKEITVAIHNLTPQYYSGKITFVVVDGQGAEILNESVDFKNIRPYTDSEKLLFFPIVDEYTVTYTVDDFQFSEIPIS